MTWKRKNIRREEVIYDGITFRRYPDAKSVAHRRYYKPHGGHIKAGRKALHQEIWIAAKGPIPEGFHVHHKDGNASNNDLSNLECISAREHERGHHLGVCTDAKRENLGKIRHLASAWHRSKEGREWHKKHGKRVWKKIKKKRLRCAYCDRSFWSAIKRAKFCSDKCYMAKHRNEGRYASQEVCVVCGKSFTNKYRYRKQAACSYSCSATNRWRKARGLQPKG